MKKYFFAGIILLAAFLRFYRLGEVPPSLYWDEASLGYNAYSVLKTAHDEHGKFLPLTNFAAFGDYKPPGYIYLSVLSVAAFGLNEFAIRFPSAFLGVLTVMLSYLLAKKLFENETVALLTTFFMALSPWHLQFSRGAFEANVGLFFSTFGIYLFLKFAKDNPLYIFPSALSFLAGMYTFTGQRLFIPFILAILAIQFKKELSKNLKIVTITALLSAILFWPLFTFVTQTIEGRLRFDEVTIFKDLEPINESTRFRELDNFSWWGNIIHNRRLFYAHQYLTHYFDAFNPSFLFFKGDINPRLSIQEVGELYLFDLPLLLAGIYFLFNNKQKYRFLIVAWLLISPLGPATARETPHALRMIHILPTFQLIGAYGFYSLLKLASFKKWAVIISAIIIVFSLYYYLHMYYLHWPRNFSGEWQYGYKEAVDLVEERYGKYDHVVITTGLGRPYIYFLLYMQFDPEKYWQTRKITRDKFFFINVDSFDKFIFKDSLESKPEGKVLYVVAPGHLPANAQKITTVKNLEEKEVFDIGEQEK